MAKKFLPIPVMIILSFWIDPAVGRHPNIVVILADDFGVGDIQAHYPDNRIPTPYLDRLVRQGMSFTDAHSPSAVCSPTRYGLLTGRYAWRTRLQEWVIAAYEPPLIAKDRPTLPGFLRDNGYTTSCVGKWHLGWDWPGPQRSRMIETRNAQKLFQWDFTQPIRQGPIERGFDNFFGVDLPNLPPFTWIEQDRVSILPSDRYVHDPSVGVVMPKYCVGCPIAPNWNFDEILPEITRRAVRQIHELAREDKPFFLYFSQTSPHEPVVPSAKFKGRSGIAPIADFVMETDWSAGQVIEAIDDAGIGDETIVIFTADNGHSHYTGWQDLVDAGHMPSGPWRGHKGNIWEGGHRVPLIVRWPNQVAANSSSNHVVSLTDLFATCAALIGTRLPDNGAEDSISFLSAALSKTDTTERVPIVNHSLHGEFAYRQGPWKLVFRNRVRDVGQCRGEPRIIELYNLEDDVAEQIDVSAQHTELVEAMKKSFQQLVERGASRPDLDAGNDTHVRVDMTQLRRWAAENNRQ